jgi:uncharacterized membrane protein YphA (DoxX/SURF4 family)
MLKLLSRFLTGAVFIFSGFVKAVDPKGGAIKISEYLEVLGIHNSDSIGLFLAIALSTVEFILGYHLILGLKIKRVALPSLLFMGAFTIITLLIAVFDPVSDCGCFGDAIKLSNWETFFKNTIILPFSIYVFYKRNEYQSALSSLRQHLITTLGLLTIVGISMYCIIYLPVIDFRPYKIGTNIPESMAIPEGADEGEYETTFILEKDGVKKEFTVDNYPYEDSTWVFVDSKTKVIREGYQPPIATLSFVSTENEDISNKIIDNEDIVFLMVAPKLNKANTKHIKDFIAIKEMTYKNDFNFYVATASLGEDCFQFDLKHTAGFEYALCDETTLKTIVRGNPGLVIIKKGTIIAKYNHSNLPSAYALKNPLSHSIQALKQSNEKSGLWLYISVMIGMLVIIYKFK